MPGRADARLYDALRACAEVATYIAGKTLDDYLRDSLLRRGVERTLEIVGENIGQAIRIDPALEDSIPNARRIVGIRNRIAHGYDDIRDDVIWSAANDGAPELASALRALLDVQLDREPPQ